MQRLLLWLAFMVPATAWAQITITGKVVNIFDKKPIENVNVFLSNASVGTATHADGSFTLSNVRPGQYDLVVSMVGFESVQQTIRVSSQNIQLPIIEIEPKATTLKEVKVRPHDDWDRNYAVFKNDFFGPSPNAEKCKILNPEILDLDFDSDTRTLNASTNDFLIIENRALGYRIKYLLNKFFHIYKDNLIYYEGSALFEELPGTESQMRRWKKAREEAYLGSSMDFLRAAISNQITERGFRVYRLLRKNNPQYGQIPGKPKYLQTLITPQLEPASYLKPTDQNGIFAITDTANLYIAYMPNHTLSDKSMADRFEFLRFPYSIVYFSKKYGFFDMNGIVLNPADVTFEGDWTKNRIANMLPVDYQLGN